MNDWQTFWNTAPRGMSDEDFFRQVGKTVGGVPITDAQLGVIVEQVKVGLDLSSTDTLLDLCCGNGLITHRLAAICQKIIGLDYSQRLIEIANRYQRASNLFYVQGDVLQLSSNQIPAGERITKVLMYEALQHFREDQLASLLQTVSRTAAGWVSLYIASIPDKNRLWSFYNTPERRQEYHRRVADGTEAIGTWWTQRFISEVAEAEGCECAYITQRPELHTAHYRFDVLLTRPAKGRQTVSRV